MQVAFYAPMKPPDHTVPSGDRAIAQALIAALTLAGLKVTLASRLQTRDGTGDDDTQRRLVAAADEEIANVTHQGKTARWQAWITYHNYYKAPDLIGPTVAAALGIPYIQIESTRARKRLTGPWARFAQVAETATDAAAVVFYFSTRDAQALRRDAPEGQHLVRLHPFLNRPELPTASTLGGAMLSVGMMRKGDKLASYEIIAETLGRLPDQDWRLEIAGDGPARKEVEQLMQPFGTRVRFLGELDAEAMQNAYANASFLLWPGVNEALGMVYLEAQAAGLPVVAQNRPGMCDLLAPAKYPDPEAGSAPLAQRISELLKDKDTRLGAGKAARRFVAENHLLPKAAQTLKSGLLTAGVPLS